MKRLILAFLCVGLVGVFAQSPLQKISTKLQAKLQSDGPNQNHLVWIYFTDKGDNVDALLSNPENVVSQKSLNRRAKVLGQTNLISFIDLPVNQNYINQLVQNGFIVKQKSRWFNSVSGYANETLINQIAQNSFVRLIDVVATFAKDQSNIEFEQNEISNDNPLQPEGTHTLNYGTSFTQVNQINVPAVHDSGYSGAGITICVLDAGFDNLPHETFNNMNIIAAWDFVNGDPNVGNESDMGEGSHGTATLSIIGGFTPGELIGPAYGANFILAKTENTDSETPVEEDNWVAGLEWADSIGVDVTSTSLGYIGYDPPFVGYTWEDMDGNTAIITRAADIAAGLGIVVVNSAGNEGYSSSHNTLGAPADGDSVFTIGAVTSGGTRSSFSSVGPTVDGRTKPDLMAMGSNVYHAGSSGNSYYGGSGTSFSCPLVAGVCALILEANPNLTPMEVLENLRSTATLSLNPNNEYGWGIIDAFDALSLGVVPVELTSFTANYTDQKVELTWITATETNNYGFEVERRDDSSGYETLAFISGNGTTTNSVTYGYVDNNLYAGRYYYRLKQVDFDGSFKYSDEVLVEIPILSDFQLFQNYPNPFNPSTKIKFYSPSQDKIKIGLYDLLGEEIAILFNDVVNSGSYEIEINGSNLASGIYFVKMVGKQDQQTIKISLIK
jgi:serine protease AprX